MYANRNILHHKFNTCHKSRNLFRAHTLSCLSTFSSFEAVEKEYAQTFRASLEKGTNECNLCVPACMGLCKNSLIISPSDV